MANLIPISKSQLAKYQKNNALNANKFFNTTKLESKTTKVVKNSPKLLESTISKIEKKVIQIDKLLKDSLIFKIKNAKVSSKEKEDKTFSEREKELEKQKPKPIKGVKLPSAPKLGFFDWIKNFIFNTLLGYFVIKFYDHLPKLLKLVPVILKVGETIIDFAGGILDSFVTLVDWGYKAYDATRGFLKNIGGENIAKTFDDISGKLNTFFNLAIIAGMAVVGSGYKAIGSAAAKVAGSAAKAAGSAAARTGAAVAGKAGVAAGARGILGTVKPLLSKLPIVGGLVEFAISWALGDPVGKAAFRGVGSALIGAIGLAIGGPIGLFLGQWAGGEGGGILYDILFNNKKTVKKFAGGGIATRGGKRPSPSGKRTLTKKKSKRTLSFSPKKIKPGLNLGGEDKVETIFPNPSKPGGLFGFLGFGKSESETGSENKQKPKEKTANPQGFLVESNNILGRADFFGPFFTIAIKSVMGQKPDQLDYQNVGKGLNSWMQQTFKSGSLGFAGGGEVDAKQFFAGEDYTDAIAKSVEQSVTKEVNSTIQDLRNELSLRPVGRQEMVEKNIEKGTEGTEEGTEVGPAGSSGDKLTMARNLMRDLGLTAAQASGIVGNMAAESGVENARPQGSRPGTKAPLKVDGVTGYGLVQWTSKGRQQALADFAKSRGADLSKPLSMDIEYQFFLKEFKGAYGHVLKQLRSAQDVKTASTIFMQQYEIPAGYKTNAKIMERYNMSKPIYDRLARGEGKATEGKGTYIPSGVSMTDSGTGGKYGRSSRGTKLSGDLGRYIYQTLKSPKDFSRVTEHPDFGGSFRRSYRSWHNVDRAVDIGAYAHEQGPILKKIQEFNRLRGVRPVELLHAKNDPKGGHNDHVHVAYARGGETLDGPHMAMIGEEGKEYVIDADSYAQTEKVAPGLLDILNYDVKDSASLQKNMPSIVSALSQYTNYEFPYPTQEFIQVPTIVEVPVEVPIPMGGGGGRGRGGVNSNDMFDHLSIG